MPTSVSLCRMCLTLTLGLTVLMALLPSRGVQARFIDDTQAKRSEGFQNHLDTSRVLVNSQNEAPQEPSLFELLISALKQSQGDDGLKRGKQFKAKPCYWSLVSCY